MRSEMRPAGHGPSEVMMTTSTSAYDLPAWFRWYMDEVLKGEEIHDSHCVWCRHVMSGLVVDFLRSTVRPGREIG